MENSAFKKIPYIDLIFLNHLSVICDRKKKGGEDIWN